jgi:chromate transport protein ChrA
MTNLTLRNAVIALSLLSAPLLCFVFATVLELRRDRNSLRSLIRVLPLAVAGVVAASLLLLLTDNEFLFSNVLNKTMAVLALAVTACGFLCRYKSRFAAVLIVVGGLFLAFVWLITQLRA